MALTGYPAKAIQSRRPNECTVGSACCLCRSPPTPFLVLPRKPVLAHIAHDLFGQIAAELLHVAAGRPAR